MVSSSVQYAYLILFDLNNKINSTGFLIQKKKEQVFKMNALSNISLSKKKLLRRITVLQKQLSHCYN
jgi:hypothetical protein